MYCARFSLAPSFIRLASSFPIPKMPETQCRWGIKASIPQPASKLAKIRHFPKSVGNDCKATASKFEVEEEFAEVILGEGGAEEAFTDAALVVMGLDALEGDFTQES